MKRIAVILICFVYLLTTVGFSMTIHHCGGKNSVQLFGININKHCKCDHEKENHSTDCCHDKLVILKADKSDKNTNKAVAVKFNSNKQIAFLPNETTILFLEDNFVVTYFKSESPPGHSPPIYLLDRAFLI